MEPASGAATLTGLLVTYIKEKRDQKSKDYSDFEGWLRRENHKEVIDRLIDNEWEIKQVGKLISANHEKLETLVATPEKIEAILQQQFDKFDERKSDLKIARKQHKLAVKLKSRLYDLAFFVRAFRQDVFSGDSEGLIRAKVRKKRRKFNKTIRRASAEWNESLEDVRKPLIDCLNEILNAYRYCEQALHGDVSYEHREKHWDNKYAIAFGEEDDNDEQGKKWLATVKAIEERANTRVINLDVTAKPN